MNRSVPFSGNIRETPLPVLLEDLNVRRVTGTLVVRNGGVEKSVYMKDGQIIFATSTDGQDRLGEILVKAGKLTREHLDAAFVLAKKSGFKKLGALLVENRFISPKDLFAGLKTQVKEIIFSLFLWDAAEYRFEESLPADTIHLQINIEELIMEIIQRIKQEA